MTSTVSKLVQLVSRAFYSDEHVVVMDFLLRNSYLKDDHTIHGTLEKAIGIQTNQIRHLLNELLEHGMVCAEERIEKIETGSKVKFMYWFINYRHFVKVVQFRLYLMEKHIKEMQQEDCLTHSVYICPSCNKGFDLLSIQKLMDPVTHEFVCDNCESNLVQNDKVDQTGGAKQLLQKFKDQISSASGLRNSIQDLILRCKEIPIPQNLPKDHLAHDMREQELAQKAEESNLKREREGGSSSTDHHKRKVSSLYTNEAGQRVVVAIANKQASEEEEKKKQEEMAAEAAHVDAENALPLWTKLSTVTGEVSGSAKMDALDRSLKINQIMNSSGGQKPGGSSSKPADTDVTNSEQFQAELERQEQLRKQMEQNAETSLETQHNNQGEPDIEFDDDEEEEDVELEDDAAMENVYVSVGGKQKLFSEVDANDFDIMDTEEYERYMTLKEGHPSPH